jgi:excinuclease UvrABC nuclease subunit
MAIEGAAIESSSQGGPVEVAVRFAWRPAGAVQLAEDGRIEFPRLPDDPGLYRFELRDDSPTTRVYIGEAVILHRRMAHYRSPGPSQRTNQRLNEVLTTHLAAGGRVLVSVVTEAFVSRGATGEEHLALSDKNPRRLAEHAALLIEDADGLENR